MNLFLVLLAALATPERTVTDPRSIQSMQNPKARPIPIEDLFFTRSVGGASWSPDGTEVVFSTDMTGRTNLWTVSAGGGWPIQLSASDDRQVQAVWSPDGKWVVFQQDKGGDELWDLYAIPRGGGEVQNLTQTPDFREEGALFSPDGHSLALEVKPKTGTHYDLAVLDWTTHKVRNVTEEKAPDRSWNSVAWSPDGKTLYGNRRNPTFEKSEVFRVDASTGAAERLSPEGGRFFASSLSRDGKTLLATGDSKAGLPNVALIDVATKKVSWVTDLAWEAISGQFAPDSSSFTYTVNEDGRTDAYLASTATLQGRKLRLPAGRNTFSSRPTPFSPKGDRLLVHHQGATSPGDFYIYDLSKDEAAPLTRSAVASLLATPLPAAQIVHYLSFDSEVISAFLFVPFNLERDGSHAGIVLPHGGPTGQTQDSWNRAVTALVSRGYVVIAPNVRGSTGYGMAFQKANYQDLGGGDLQDEVFAAQFLSATGYVDAKRIGITGGSYGGFMTLMAISKTPEVFAAGVEQFGIINWLTMLQHEDPTLQEYEKGLLGDPVKDRAVYERCSPLAYIHQTRAPLLVLQGENDPRVPKEEAEQAVATLEKDGKVVEAHYYAREGHGFAKRENQIDAIQRTVAWFDRYLRKH